MILFYVTGQLFVACRYRLHGDRAAWPDAITAEVFSTPIGLDRVTFKEIIYVLPGVPLPPGTGLDCGLPIVTVECTRLGKKNENKNNLVALTAKS